MNTQVKQTKTTKRLIDNLKYIKFCNGLSQEQLAKTIEVNRQSIGGWFEGRSLPTTLHLQKISDAFRISINDLIRVDIMDAPDSLLEFNYRVAQFNLNLN